MLSEYDERVKEFSSIGNGQYTVKLAQNESQNIVIKK